MPWLRITAIRQYASNAKRQPLPLIDQIYFPWILLLLLLRISLAEMPVLPVARDRSLRIA
jgi:hypothetical protein